MRFHALVAPWAVIVSSSLASASDPPASATTPAAQPAASAPATGGRTGDPYALTTCPITGKKLGSMGDPVVKVYDGREVRFCCTGCPGKFEADQAANLAKVDAAIIADQAAVYPLKTSVVTGEALPDKPYEFVHGNRLVRLGAETERADFLKDGAKHIAALDKAAIAAQGPGYALTTCPVSGEELGGMGEPTTLVIGGRLLKLCCDGCKEKAESEPAKVIAAADAARKAAAAKSAGSAPDPKPSTPVK